MVDVNNSPPVAFASRDLLMVPYLSFVDQEAQVYFSEPTSPAVGKNKRTLDHWRSFFLALMSVVSCDGLLTAGLVSICFIKNMY